MLTVDEIVATAAVASVFQKDRRRCDDHAPHGFKSLARLARDAARKDGIRLAISWDAQRPHSPLSESAQWTASDRNGEHRAAGRSIADRDRAAVRFHNGSTERKSEPGLMRMSVATAGRKLLEYALTICRSDSWTCITDT